jgi:hypothetical protein
MRIEFPSNPEKAAAVVEHLAGRADENSVATPAYIAERDHFLMYGRPICGGELIAGAPGPAARRMRVRGRIPVAAPVGGGPVPELTADEIRTPDAVLARADELLRTARELPEYREAYVPGAEAPIPYEPILRHHGGERGFRLGRPVISPEAAAAMTRPFPASEPDL